VVRSDNPTCLTKAGWDDLEAYGIRTVLSLRTLGATEPEPKCNFMPSDVTLEEVFIEDISDLDFVERCVNTGLWCTPIYFHEMLDHAPDRCAAAVSAVANAPPGGVVISCAKGLDRTGLLAFLLLALVGVSAGDIATDWLMSVERLRPRDPNYGAFVRELLANENTTVIKSIETTLATVDLPHLLCDGGLAPQDLQALRDRLVSPTLPTGP
jgi:hypothetical protein